MSKTSQGVTTKGHCFENFFKKSIRNKGSTCRTWNLQHWIIINRQSLTGSTIPSKKWPQLHFVIHLVKAGTLTLLSTKKLIHMRKKWKETGFTVNSERNNHLHCGEKKPSVDSSPPPPPAVGWKETAGVCEGRVTLHLDLLSNNIKSTRPHWVQILIRSALNAQLYWWYLKGQKLSLQMGVMWSRQLSWGSVSLKYCTSCENAFSGFYLKTGVCTKVSGNWLN